MGVRLVGVTKTFEDLSRPGATVTAVRDVSLDVADGELVTLLGPSGCGKTTTLRIVSGFETATGGEVWIAGERVDDVPPNRRDTSMVFQSYALFPHMSVEQNIGFGLELKGHARASIRDEVRRIMSVMNLEDLGRRRPDQLSGGQQQRVALARAVINKPGVLLFDEPLSNLDAKLREQMRIEIRRVQKSLGITSIYVTHDQAEAMTVSDRIVVMDAGEVRQIGTPFEVYSRPANRFVADFVGRVNFFQGRAAGESAEGLLVEVGGRSVAVGSRGDGIAVGDPVTVVVRPESLRLARGEAPQAFAAGRISRAVYLGDLVQYEIDIQGERPVLAVSYDPIDAGFFREGDTVTVNFSARAAHALPAEDGGRRGGAEGRARG
jgi:iron(III) transport system ATP-binding protein